jgi:hypothetical protein
MAREKSVRADYSKFVPVSEAFKSAKDRWKRAAC